jgi:hypothetical protein
MVALRGRTVVRKVTAVSRIDLRADLNAEDDEGRWWTLLTDAADPAQIVPGAVVVAGTERFWSVVRIDQVDDDGQVHFVAASADDPAAPVFRAPRPAGNSSSRAQRAGRL